MNSCKRILAAVIMCLSPLAAAPAHAATIDYIFSGIFDGSLDSSTNFTGQPFTVLLNADTANITTGGGEFFNVANSATYSIGAFTGSLTGNFNEVILNPAFAGGTIAFGQSQSSPSAFVAEGLSNSNLGSYDLSTVFPLTSGAVSQTPGSTYRTSGGDLVFANISSASFEAVSPTPLPAAFPLFATGVAMIGFLAWNRKWKAFKARSE